MSSANKTTNLKLPQFIGSDTFEETDFNDAFLKIDQFSTKSGVSPIVAVKENTLDSYILEITDVNGKTTTPNLKGGNGADGKDGLTTSIKLDDETLIQENGVIDLGVTKIPMVVTYEDDTTETFNVLAV